MAQKLKLLYYHIDEVEWLVGLFAEDYGSSSMMGELMVTMVANDAFTQALTNPLLSANIYNEDTFSALGMEIINNTKGLADIIVRNTTITERDSVGFKYRQGGV